MELIKAINTYFKNANEVCDNDRKMLIVMTSTCTAAVSDEILNDRNAVAYLLRAYANCSRQAMKSYEAGDYDLRAMFNSHLFNTMIFAGVTYKLNNGLMKELHEIMLASMPAVVGYKACSNVSPYTVGWRELDLIRVAPTFGNFMLNAAKAFDQEAICYSEVGALAQFSDPSYPVLVHHIDDAPMGITFRCHEDVARGRVTEGKLGRILRTLNPELNDQELCDYVNGNKRAVVKYANTKEEIRRVYSPEFDLGSCMAKYSDDFEDYSDGDGKFRDMLPVDAYADCPDISIAYLERGGVVIARSVVSNRNMQYSSTYGDWTLDSMLRKDGYEQTCDALEDCRIQYIEFAGHAYDSSRRMVAPYLDSAGYADLSTIEYDEVTGLTFITLGCDKDNGTCVSMYETSGGVIVEDRLPKPCDCCGQLHAPRALEKYGFTEQGTAVVTVRSLCADCAGDTARAKGRHVLAVVMSDINYYHHGYIYVPDSECVFIDGACRHFTQLDSFHMEELHCRFRTGSIKEEYTEEAKPSSTTVQPAAIPATMLPIFDELVEYEVST